PLQLGAEGELGKIVFQSLRLARLERARETEFAVFADCGNEFFSLPIDDQGASLGGARDGALHGIDGDLPRDMSTTDEWRGQLVQTLIVNCDGGNDAVVLGLFDHFEIARHLLWRI